MYVKLDYYFFVYYLNIFYGGSSFKIEQHLQGYFKIVLRRVVLAFRSGGQFMESVTRLAMMLNV